ncbi:DUF4129 domain-containing protein [Haloarchaeobius sp. HRN-SO-5]|uniref:DUF4129 domain-containing protein n=1 Tax=Haloarchaeobius sp. HRN-SO-5 TaxID=3446118 RepID=UPI003EBCE920
MDYESALSVGLAVCLLFALGASANALESAIETEPDDVIDIDYASLPLSQDETGELKDAVTGDPAAEDTRSASASDEGDPSGEVPDPGGDDEQSADSMDSDDDDAGGDGESDDQGGASAEQASGPAQQQTAGSGGEGPSEEEQSLLERLLALLQQLLPLILLLATLAVLYLLRHRILEAFRDRFGERADGPADPPVTYVAEPDDEVSEAWYEMVSALNLDQDVSKTPRECARAAADAGVNPTVARSLTDLYEQVRYAGEPITDERIQLAEENLHQFRRQYGGASLR